MAGKKNLTRRGRRLLPAIIAAMVGVGMLSTLPATAGPGPSKWSTVNGPATVGLSMNAVAALSAHDAWAVGTLHPDGRPDRAPHAAVARWNGHRWAMAAAPAGAQELTSISARSPHDIWVGGYRNASFGPTRIWHFNGQHWSAVASRGLPGGITGKVIANGSHVWLVGEVDPGHRIEGAVVATYHRSAHRWSVNDLSKVGGFVAGTTVGSKRAWAVGSTSKYDDLGHPMIATWNGHRWSVRTFPHVLGQLTGVAAHSAGEAIAVGYNGTNYTTQGGIVLQRSGSGWREMGRKQMGKNSGLDTFTSVAAGPKHEYWAGIRGRNRLHRANYLHFANGVWRHERSPHVDSAPASYFADNAVALGMTHVPGTAITLAVGSGPLDYRQPPTRVVPLWNLTRM